MSADRIIYCLERLSDYRDFERLCSALLAGLGYPQLDPLGGTGDKGRDAVIRRDDAGRSIVFAYTVREDWRVKLKGDCNRINAVGHALDVLVFVCTEALSASDKDWAIAMVRETFGWELDLFDLERLRMHLVGPHKHLVAQHTSIFSPPFFPQKGGQSLVESRDTIVIDHVDADHALATWLARRLSLAGYLTWCRGTAPLAGENPDDTIRALLELRTVQYLPVLSAASLNDGGFLERCVIAGAKEDFVLPCNGGDVGDARVPTKLSKLSAAAFNTSWMAGLSQTLEKLKALGITPQLDANRGRSIALADYLPMRVTVARPEPVFANIFRLSLPKVLNIFELRSTCDDDDLAELRKTWACVRLSTNKLAAFTEPPMSLKVMNRTQSLWEEIPEKEGVKTLNIAKELARSSLELACRKKGLLYCTDRRLFYFPTREKGEWNQAIRHVDGRKTTVQLTGERTKGWGERASLFLYQLAPLFTPQRDPDGAWNMLVKVYIRVTTTEGAMFEKKEIGRRRKVVSKGWWNNLWLPRLLGVVQALETAEGAIEVGNGSSAVVMQTAPLTWQCPVGLDVAGLSGSYDLGEELAEYRARDDDDEIATEGAAE